MHNMKGQEHKPAVNITDGGTALPPVYGKVNEVWY